MTADRDLLKTLLDEIHVVKEDDPNVNLFLGVLNDKIDDVKKALDDGANVNITDAAVIDYHRPLLRKRCRHVLAEWDAQRKQRSSRESAQAH